MLAELGPRLLSSVCCSENVMRLLIVLVVGVVAVVFAVQNVVVVPISVLFWRVEASLAVVIAVCVVLGALLGVLVSVPRILRMRTRERNLRTQLADLGAYDLDRQTASPENGHRAHPVEPATPSSTTHSSNRMTVVALVLVLGAAPVLISVPSARAAEQENKITTKAVAEPIQKAQAAMSRKQWDAALAQIKQAQAVANKTPFEAYQIDEFLGYVLLQQKKFAEAAPVFERTLSSDFLPAERVDDRTKTVAQLYATLGEHRKAVQWAGKWLEKHPGDLDMRVLLGQSYYLLNDFKNAATTMTAAVNQAEKAGQTPREEWLKIILASHFKLDDPQDRAQALRKMVRYHPKPEYWANLLDLSRGNDSSDAITLGYYRLMNEVGVLDDKDDYVEMAQLAMDAGLPGEARSIVEKGFANGTLKSSNTTEQGRYDRLSAAVKEQAAADSASLPQLARQAEKATQGQAHVALGQAYLSYGDYDKAVAALQRGLKEGGVSDVAEAQISLGIAQLRQGQNKLALEAFNAVPDKSPRRDLAELWALRAQTAKRADGDRAE